MIINFKKEQKKSIFIFIVALIIGFISSFSLPPYNIPILNFICYPIIFIIFCFNSNNRTYSFIVGWIFGFGYFLSNIYWITNSLTFDANFTKLIPFALILIPAFLGLFYGASFLITSLFSIKKNLSSILIFALVLSLFEYLRGTILTGFPWNLIVFSISNYLSSLQILSIIGTYTLNLITITIFITPVLLFTNKNFLSKFFLVLIISTIILTNFLYGSKRINSYNLSKTNDINTSIKIVSPKIDISKFFEQKDLSDRINKLVDLSNPEIDRNYLYIFPEGILSGILLDELKEFQILFDSKFNEKDRIIIGINSEENFQIFNSMVLLDSKLNVLSKYNKNKLVPFGEFLPFESILSNFNLKKITQGYTSFSRANLREKIEVDGLKILPLICYEIIYTGKLNNDYKKFDIIVNISEDGWFGGSIGPYQHFYHSIFRSIEEGKNILRSSNNGISALISPVGQVKKRIESTQSGVILINKLKQIEKTHFSNFGNKIFFYFIGFYITLIFFLKRKGIK